MPVSHCSRLFSSAVRRFISTSGPSATLLSAALFLAPCPQASAAQSGNTCHPPADVHTAFNLAGLKSELMVTALSCQMQDRYNEFIARFRPFLLKADARLDSYFRTTYGRQGQRQHDDYTTQLADIQSLGGLKSGTVFCDQRVPMFDEVAALETAEDLSRYAEAKDVAQPASYENCSAPQPPHKTIRRH